MFLLANIISYAIIPSVEKGSYITFQGGDICLQKNLMKTLRLAQKVLSRICAKLVGFLNKYLHSTEFFHRHRLSEKYFSRTRKLPFSTVILFLMNFVRCSLQKELDGFFQLFQFSDRSERKVTASAFCRARRKISFEAFVDLNQRLLSFFYQSFPVRRWMGFRLLAVDGSTLRVPDNDETRKFFGVWHPAKTRKTCPLARVSLLYDVLNRITVHALMVPKGEGERSLAAKHVQNTGEGDLLLLDRGYPAYWLFALILNRGSQFLCRMKKDSVLVREFLRSGKREAIVTLKPSPAAIKFCQEKNLSTNPLKVRVLRFTLKNRVKVVLLTSLLDKRQFPLAELKELYTKRWSVETAYSHFKCRIEIENFSGKSPLAVLQDFHARVLTANLTAMIVHPVQDFIEEQAKNHPERLRYQVNFTYALSSMKNNVVLLFARRHITKILRSLLSLLGKSLSIIRPGRKNPRKRGPKLKIAAMAYKPIA